VRLARLPERLVKLLAILATLSFLIIELAEALTRCSPLARPLIPGNGKISRLQMSETKLSSLALSTRDGASTGIRLVDKSDCDLLIGIDDEACEFSFRALVFLMITWHSDDLGPTVVAR
jgi:hypothetical protein